MYHFNLWANVENSFLAKCKLTLINRIVSPHTKERGLGLPNCSVWINWLGAKCRLCPPNQNLHPAKSESK